MDILNGLAKQYGKNLPVSKRSQINRATTTVFELISIFLGKINHGRIS
jgi:hypothetical protein